MHTGNLNLWMYTALIVLAWIIFLALAFMTRKTMGYNRAAAEICLLCLILIGIIIGTPTLWIFRILLGLPVFLVGVILIAMIYRKKQLDR
jgi:hypothetical protein